MHRIGRDETSGCYHCVDRPEDLVEHMVEVCPAWADHRRVLRDAVGGGDFSRPALVEAMVWGGAEPWEGVNSFCEVIMPAKEEASRDRDRHPTSVSQPRRPPESEWSPDRTPARTPKGPPSAYPRRSPANVNAGLRMASSR